MDGEHHLNPRPEGLPVPGGCRGLGHPPGARLEALQHPRCALLHGRRRRSPPALRPARDLQRRPGSQFTSLEFTSVLKDSGVAISMDGRGRCMDNIFIEHLWRSLKYEAVHVHEISDGLQAQCLISRWFAFVTTGGLTMPWGAARQPRPMKGECRCRGRPSPGLAGRAGLQPWWVAPGSTTQRIVFSVAGQRAAGAPGQTEWRTGPLTPGARDARPGGSRRTDRRGRVMGSAEGAPGMP